MKILLISLYYYKGIYPGLFDEKEIWSIANEINPVIPNTRRVERTSITYNNFVNMIQDRVHLIISLESGINYHILT